MLVLFPTRVAHLRRDLGRLLGGDARLPCTRRGADLLSRRSLLYSSISLLDRRACLAGAGDHDLDFLGALYLRMVLAVLRCLEDLDTFRGG